ncbi:MAG TPA: GAF domain-containing sensor histidine kinase, partial [Longimicrobiales bacterium]|nr:GAF domain-containing sensor histidine kinase [Longimicrobiales bacterium]
DQGRFLLTDPGAAAECMRTGEPVFLESGDAVRARYPAVVETWETLGTEALATIPLQAAGETVGAMSFTFTTPRAFPPEDRDFFLTFARQGAQALERSRLFAAEKEARATAERARAEAEAANRAKSQFLATMSHELRTPLNAIGGYAELLEIGVHGPLTAGQAHALSRIQASQRHLLGLINDVLNYTRLEAGAVQYEIEPTPVAGTILACEALTAPQMRAKDLTFHVDYAEPSLVVLADADKLRQILLNLLSNAIKFTDPGGAITVRAAARGDTVAIEVSDIGRGIPASRLESIFEPFVQVDASLTRTSQGVGLGLAISRDLARGMGGDLTAESVEGVGSTFTLTLPRAE